MKGIFSGNRLTPFFAILGFGLLWEAVVRLGGANMVMMPPPSLVLLRLWDMMGPGEGATPDVLMLRHIGLTLFALLAGFLGAAVVSSAIGLTMHGQPITGPGANRGMVFQEYLLFPWMKVKDNITYGMRIAKASKAEQEAKCRELVEMIGLEGFEDVYPETLSGGMRQRVAIARALAYDPEFLLMDEPFGALDAQTRSRLITDLIRIHKATQKTTLFVTHSVEEAILLSDRVALFSARPSRIKEVFEIDMPYPRKVTDAKFVEYEKRILGSLDEESTCAREVAQSGHWSLPRKMY